MRALAAELSGYGACKRLQFFFSGGVVAGVAMVLPRQLDLIIAPRRMPRFIAAGPLALP